MSLTAEDVEKVSRLARLTLTADELVRATAHLGQIVEYVESLNELNTDDVEPLAHVADISNCFRRDEVKPSLDREAALANAPKHTDECYLVPAVFGESS